MRNIDEDTITQAVLASMDGCGNPRLHTVMTGLVQHLHAFAREVKLTEDEWFTAIKFLTDVGNITDDKRQEFVLLSDTLGLSMLVTTQNNRKPAACTEATVLGPFLCRRRAGVSERRRCIEWRVGRAVFCAGSDSRRERRASCRCVNRCLAVR
jgi:hypothetical protein